MARADGRLEARHRAPEIVLIGSLQRPPELLCARDEFMAGRMTAAAFKDIEDRAVDWAVELQEEAGLEVVTDGVGTWRAPRSRGPYHLDRRRKGKGDPDH